MEKEKIISIVEKLSKKYPNAGTGLKSTNDFTFLIAVLMSAHTTDKAVNKASEKLFELADTPQKMIEIGEDKIRDLIKTVGLHGRKANNIVKLSEILIEKHEGKIPTSKEELEELPGVGSKTASVVLNTLFGKSFVGVDTHVFRVANRVGITEAKGISKTEKQIYERVPKNLLKNLHNLLGNHGKQTCKAINPKCNSCPLQEECHFLLSKKKTV